MIHDEMPLRLEVFAIRDCFVTWEYLLRHFKRLQTYLTPHLSVLLKRRVSLKIPCCLSQCLCAFVNGNSLGQTTLKAELDVILLSHEQKLPNFTTHDVRLNFSVLNVLGGKKRTYHIQKSKTRGNSKNIRILEVSWS